MPALPSDLRRVLENAVIAARDEATTAAAAALKRLAVATKEFPNYLSVDERVLRQKLRAAARQLGDPWNADKQAFGTLNKLTQEVAYEHWHRMLFARFLAENNLLIHSEHGVPVDLATVADLAGEEARKTGAKADTWALAGRYAAAMLPQIFRPDDPALAVLLAPEHQQALEKILESLPPQVFTADDSLGWVYQFWQSAEKDRVNDTVKAGAKITGETLPAVTQLFTEHYMVLFLLHNTVGAWHVGKVLATPEGQKRAAACTTEAELRDLVALPGYAFEYLRFIKDDASPAKWRPAGGVFASWPKAAKDLKVLDPCCGSGHFLVAALELLARLRVAEEGLDAKAAALGVIAHNLFGLELDARCTQIAAFNVAQAAWRLAGEHFAIPELHIACAGLGPSTSLEQWMKLADKNSKAWEGFPLHGREPVRRGFEHLHSLFSKAPELGSLIDPHDLPQEGLAADWETMQPFLQGALKHESNDDAHERAIAAQGMAKAAEILAGDYTLVTTNVPYLGRGNQSETLRSFADECFPDAKNDLATIFLARSINWLHKGATAAVVLPQNWLFLARYARFRAELLRRHRWDFLARLGPGAFETIGGHVVSVALLGMSREAPLEDHWTAGWDGEVAASPTEKSELLRSAEANRLNQSVVRAGREAIVAFNIQAASNVLGQFADTWQGLVTCDDNRYICNVWEIVGQDGVWMPIQHPPQQSRQVTATHAVVRWEGGAGALHKASTAHNFPPPEALGRDAVAMQRTSRLSAAVMWGGVFGDAVAPVFPKDPSHLTAIWCYAESGELSAEVRRLDKQVKTAVGSFLKVPFDLERWQAVADQRYPGGLPGPSSNSPTESYFHGHPAYTDMGDVLQAAVGRLVGYRWPAELDTNMRLAPEARSLVERCKELESHSDDDGVVPLVNINKERPGHERVRALLEAAFGDRWTPGLLNDLLAAAGAPGKSVEEWLRAGDFWAQHCAVFHHRPFIWQIWDGKKDGFNILVHYHRLAEGDGKGHKLLQKITYTYLGDWIAQQQAAAKRGEPGADTRLKAAQDLQKKLEAILAGEPPYDIFVRWKPLHEQPIGWNPDINDGVRMNIRPFVTAGILRGKVNVKWTKDRGKEPESLRPKAQFPWFWSCPEDDPPIDFAGGAKFTGERLNNLHYTRKAKEAAQERSGKGQAK